MFIDAQKAKFYPLPMTQQPLPGNVETLSPCNGSLLIDKRLKPGIHSSSVAPWISNYFGSNPVIAGCRKDSRMNPAGVVIIERL